MLSSILKKIADDRSIIPLGIIENIPKNIIDLELNNNNISNADYNYPLTLIKLNLSFNRISNINSIPEHIDELEISNNYIRKIEFIGKINY